MEPTLLKEQGDHLQVVDVREPEEWHAGRIPGSQWIPMNELSDRLGELDQQCPVVTVCRSGQRSGQMAELLTERGYRADSLDGGIAAWAEQQLPIRTPGEELPGRVG